MSDLSELAAVLGAKPRMQRVYTAADTIPRSHEVGPQPDANFVPQVAEQFDPNATPGDPGFDWSKYGEWKNAYNATEAPTMQMGHQIKAEQEKALRDEQEAKFASGEIDTTGKRHYAREILASATPEKMAALAGLLAVPLTGGASIPMTAAIEGLAAGAGHIAGDVSQRQAQSMGSEYARPSSGLADELAQAGETALATGATTGAIGAGSDLVGRVSKPLLLKVAGHIPGSIGRAARLAQLVGVGAEETAPAVRGASRATNEIPDFKSGVRPRPGTTPGYSRYEPSASGYRGPSDIGESAAAVEQDLSGYPRPTGTSFRVQPGPNAHAEAEAQNVARGTSYGNGGIVPEPMPVERQDPAMSALREHLAPRAPAAEPDLADFEYLGGEAEPVAGYTTLTPPSVELPPPARAEGLPKSWQQFAAPARKFSSPKRPSRARAVSKD